MLYVLLPTPREKQGSSPLMKKFYVKEALK